MKKMRTLSQICASDLSKLVKCAAGGRDHLPCCQRRGVPTQCQVWVLNVTHHA